jgi:hypothetical protein
MCAWGHLGQGGGGGRSPPRHKRCPRGCGCACAQRSPGGRQCNRESEIHAVGGVAARLRELPLPAPHRCRICWYVSSSIASGRRTGSSSRCSSWVYAGGAVAGRPLRPVHPSSNSACPRPPRARPSPGAFHGPPRQRPPPRVGVGNGSPRPHHLDSAPLPPPPVLLHGRASALPAGARIPRPRRFRPRVP